MAGKTRGGGKTKNKGNPSLISLTSMMNAPTTFVTAIKKTNMARGMPNPPLRRKPLTNLWKGTASWW
jgi:hypothetical protein